MGPELSGKSEKDQRAYVPANFPSFPGKHAYKFTFNTSERQSDPRHVRELATAEGRLGEEALRRLVSNAWNNPSGERDATRVKEKRSRQDKLQAMWRETMEKVEEQGDPTIWFDGAGDGSRDAPSDLEQMQGDRVARPRLGGPVNYERQYWRKDPRGRNQRGRTAPNEAGAN